MWLSPFIVRARPCFQDGVFRVPKNGMLETNKPLAMRVVGNALAYRKSINAEGVRISDSPRQDITGKQDITNLILHAG